MAESFTCGDRWVHFSNGAVESLFECWERLARERIGSPGMETLAAYLGRKLAHGGPGARAFGMNREFLPDELTPPDAFAALLEVVNLTAANPTLISDVNWSHELVADWRDRLEAMAQTLRASGGEPTP